MSDYYDDPFKKEKVGYKRPPKSTRFKKGQSGNPKGRPKNNDSKELSFVRGVMAELRKEVQIKENGEVIKITKHEAIVKAIVHNAMNGRLNDINNVIKICEKEYVPDLVFKMVRGPEPKRDKEDENPHKKGDKDDN